MMADNRNQRFVTTALAIPLLCLLVIFLLNFVVDPYEMNNYCQLGLDKEKVSLPCNYRLYKIGAFLKKPCANIILGDSRMNSLSVLEILKFSGEPYFNFSYGGGTVAEIIDTFWFAARHTQLKNVYIGINFNLYNRYNARNLFPEALNLASHNEQYYLSFFVTKVSCYNLYYKFSGMNPASEKPRLTKKAFWSKQLREVAFFYTQYAYPVKVYRELKKIRQYCLRHQINLVLIIPPTHVDLQKKVRDYSLTKEYEKYKEDLASISKVIDFDYPNQWTKDQRLFLDPYHGDDFIQMKLVKEIWGNQLLIGRELGN